MTIKFQGKTLKLNVDNGPYAGPKRTQWFNISSVQILLKKKQD